MTKTVLVVEDDPAIRRGLVDALQFADYTVIACADGTEGMQTALGAALDLAILDVMLPGHDGFEILAEVRKARPALPVILVTARGAEQDRIHGLKTGADDYVVKPFSMVSLVARLRALLRRAAGTAPAPLAAGDLRLDPVRRRVWRGDDEIVLTARQFEVLEYFLRRVGEVLSKDELLRGVWSYDFDGDPNIVEVYVRRLRSRIDEPFGRRSIETLRGQGYRLDPSGG